MALQLKPLLQCFNLFTITIATSGRPVLNLKIMLLSIQETKIDAPRYEATLSQRRVGKRPFVCPPVITTVNSGGQR